MRKRRRRARVRVSQKTDEWERTKSHPYLLFTYPFQSSSNWLNVRPYVPRMALSKLRSDFHRSRKS
jgi:hypothetical protein